MVTTITTEYGTLKQKIKRTGEIIMNKKLNNGVTNNNSNNGKGEFIMSIRTIGTVEAFASVIKSVMEQYFDDSVHVEIQKVKKNNGLELTGIVIMEKSTNIAPTIYLEGYFSDYRNGESMINICERILKVYNENKVTDEFDISMVTDFNRAKHHICYKLVNAERNVDLLADAPHVLVEDLAVIFYIVATKDEMGTGTITIKNRFLEMWQDVTVDELYQIALDNTQHMFRGRVTSMMNVLTEIMAEELDEEYANEFFDMVADGDIPMFIATNTAKLNGAGVILYKDLLKTFAEKIRGDFYILPSSVHETLFIPAADSMDVDYLHHMVREVNATEVSPEEFLSDNVYRYDSLLDRMEIV